MIAYNLEDALKFPDTVTSLVLYRRSLQTWPDELFRLTKLRHLELDQCGITHLDERLKDLPLTSLKLPNNAIVSLPGWLGENRLLQHLDLRANRIKGWPAGTQPPGLITVALADNRLWQLPEELLTQVESLDVSRNPLTECRWPAALPNLHEVHLDRSPVAANRFLDCHATALTRLTLTRSRLEHLPVDFFSRFPALTQLDLSGNLLTVFPEPGRASDLPCERLQLAKNKITRLPQEWGALSKLRKLDLGGNMLHELPRSMGQLVHLTQVNLAGNPIVTLPDEWASLPDLNQLDIRKTRIASIPLQPWNRLEKFAIHDTPLSAREDILRSLPISIQVTGKKSTTLSSGSISLSRFRNQAIRKGWSMAHQERIWQLAQGDPVNRKNAPALAELCDLWSLGLPGVRERIVQMTPGRKIAKGDRLRIFGRTWLPKEALRIRAEQSGICLTKADDTTANQILLGSPNGALSLLDTSRQTWWTESTLLARLPACSPPRAARPDNEDQQRSLLRSGLPAYHMIAMQSFFDHGIPTGLLGEILLILRENRLPGLQKKWPELITLFGPAEWTVDCLQPKKAGSENTPDLAKKWNISDEALAHWTNLSRPS